MRTIPKVRRPAKDDPLRFIHDDTLRTLALDLDEVRDTLLGAALEGTTEAYGHAEIVRQAVDLVINLRTAR
jgi:hypothetical protein